MFDLQHSKSNSPKRILTFFKKIKDSPLTQLFKLNKFGILTCITFYKKKEKRTYQRLFKAKNWLIELVFKFFTISHETEWKRVAHAIKIPLLSQRYLKFLKEPSKSEQSYKDMLLMNACKKHQMKQNVTSCTFKINNAGILKKF